MKSTDYRRGAATLQIRDEIDKNLFGRELPLSDAARAALEVARTHMPGVLPRPERRLPA